MLKEDNCGSDFDNIEKVVQFMHIAKYVTMTLSSVVWDLIVCPILNKIFTVCSPENGEPQLYWT